VRRSGINLDLEEIEEGPTGGSINSRRGRNFRGSIKGRITNDALWTGEVISIRKLEDQDLGVQEEKGVFAEDAARLLLSGGKENQNRKDRQRGSGTLKNHKDLRKSGNIEQNARNKFKTGEAFRCS